MVNFKPPSFSAADNFRERYICVVRADLAGALFFFKMACRCVRGELEGGMEHTRGMYDREMASGHFFFR